MKDLGNIFYCGFFVEIDIYDNIDTVCGSFSSCNNWKFVKAERLV